MGLLKSSDTSLVSLFNGLVSESACSCGVSDGESGVIIYARLWDSKIALTGTVDDGDSWCFGLM